MEEELLSFQLFTPGSDIAIGFRPNQLIWGRTGNDVLMGYQPISPAPGTGQIDILIGDLAIEDPTLRQWRDTFILGDWVGPYYTSGSPENLGLTELAVIPDFNPEIDFIQLFGTVENYQLSDVEFGSLILFVDDGELDAIAFLLSATDIDLTDNFFEFRGSTPPTGPIQSKIRQLGSAGFDIQPNISTDIFGNIYVAGSTNGELLGENAGLRDNFIVKYDTAGNVLFAEQFGTPGFETIYGIETDNEGNFYITGVTDGELGGPRQAELLDTFVAKYDSNGNQLWIRQLGQNDVFNAFNLAVDKDTGDVFISGADVQPTLEDDTFVIKFDTNGEQQWFTKTGLSGFLSFDESYGLTVADDGSVYTTGWTFGDLGGPNAGLYDNWIGKYDNATGENLWLVQYGTPDYEWSWDVRTDSAGNIYTAGWTLGDLGGPNNGSFDAYLTKFDDQGNLIWIEQFGSAGGDEAFSLYIDNSDNIFIAGYTDGNLGGPNAGSLDAWIAKYDQSGKQIWINQFGTPDRDELYGIVADDQGSLYATGVTQGSLGAINTGSFDGWIAKLDAVSGQLVDFGAATAATLTVGIFDADNDTLITSLEDGAEILASTLAGRNLTISALVPQDSSRFNQVESIFLNLNEGQVKRRERVEPYALFGDQRGDLRGRNLDLPVGDNTISFDLFADDRGRELLETVVIDFSIVDDSGVNQAPTALDDSAAPPEADELIVEVGLYNADSDELIRVIQDGDSIESSALPQNLAIAARVLDSNPLASAVESIFLDLNNGQKTRTESIEPYALFGDTNGDFNGGSLPQGLNTLDLELYDRNGDRGQLLEALTVNFVIL